MPTRIPPTEFSQIIQTNSSPAIIAALLNTAETTYSNLQKKSHGNARRVYPFWKICTVCSQPFPCETREQAIRNLTCGPVCAAERLRQARTGIRRVAPRVAICPQCQQEFTPGPHVTRGQKYCSRSCHGKAHAGHLLPYSANGKGKRRPGKGLAGPANPAWKGGVTYFKTHGNYTGVKYVRCPAAYAGMARKDGYVMEHRLLVAQAIGRLLLRTEVVHHKDHNPTNNALTNLELFASNQAHKLYEHHGSPAPIWP